MVADRNGPPVTVCGAWSAFLQITVLRTLTVMLLGWYAKFLMVTNLVAATAPSPDLLGIDMPGIGLPGIGLAGEDGCVDGSVLDP